MIDFDKLFRQILALALPGVEPMRFAWGPALSPLKAELLGLRRNHARDEIELNALLYEQSLLPGAQYFFAVAWRPWRMQREIDALTERQTRREARIAQIVAKLERDRRMKAPKHRTTG